MASSSMKFYRLDLTNAPAGLDLAIFVLPETESNAPELFVSHQKEFPQSVDDADYHSTPLSAGSKVFLKNKGLQETSHPLYIGLFCPNSECQGNLFAELSASEISPSHYRTLSNEVHKLLSPNTPFYGVLKQAESHYFESLLLAGDPSITISGHSDSGNIDLYISTDPNNKYPNQGSYTYTTKASITLTSKDREKACGTSKSLACSVYITVTSTGDQEETSYLLSIRRDSAPEQANPAIALEDGREIQANIPLDSDIPTVFYYATSRHSIVTVRCPGREIMIFAKGLRTNFEFFTKPDLSNLDKGTAEFTSIENPNNIVGTAFISVPPLTDSDLTIVAISVYFKETQEESNQTTTFTILASSQINYLFTETPYSGFVPQDHYVYFMIPIMKSECTLLISLTNLDDEGDADLVLSLGQDSRPTISGYQFASISHERTKIIQINNTDISPSISMSGNWVLGVYGRTASSFNLVVAYEDKKIINLTPGTPLQMYLDESSSMNFKFFHQLKANLQIMLTTFSGELNLYLTSLNSTQNLASNLPDSTHYKWQISHGDSQSFINVPVADPQACISCIYLIHLEAILSSSFSLAVNEGDTFVPLQDGLPYSEHLKAQGSAPFVLRTSSDTEEAQLKIDIGGSELEILISNSSTINLTNYLRKEIIASNLHNHVISFQKSQKDEVFYFLFYNPTNTNVSYNFTMARKSSKTFLIQGGYQKIDYFPPYEKISLLYYSNIENGQISFDISFSAAFKEGYNVQESIESALRQGQIVKGRYWPEEETLGPGQEVPFEASAPGVEGHDTWAVIHQRLLIKNSSVGKYIIEVANTWEFPFTFWINGPGNFFGENLQGEYIIEKEITTFGFFMAKTSVKWYYWFYTCSLPVDLKIECGNQEKKLVKIPQGGSYLYRDTIGDNEIKDRFRDVTVSTIEFQRWQSIFMYSSLINESKLWDYEVKNDELKMSLSYKYEKGNNQVAVEFDPVEFKDPEPTDMVNYNVEICPFEYDSTADISICEWIDDCQGTDLEFSISYKETIKVKFENAEDGKYIVRIKAFVKHKEHLIRFVPYIVGHVDVTVDVTVTTKYPVNPFVVALEIIMVLILWKMCSGRLKRCGQWCKNLCKQCWEKMRRNRESQRVELQAIRNIENQRNYNQLEENEGRLPVINEEGQSPIKNEVNID